MNLFTWLIRTEKYFSLCGAQSKIVQELDKTALEFFDFVLGKYLYVFRWLRFLKGLNLVFQTSVFSIRVYNMDQQASIVLDKIFSDGDNQEKTLWSCWGQTCSMSLITVCPNFLSLCWSSLVALENSCFRNLYWIKWLFEKFVKCSRMYDTIYFCQVSSWADFYKYNAFLSMVGPSETKKCNWFTVR